MTEPSIVLFDWNTGGHHPYFLRYAAEALADVGTVIIAAPAATHEDLSDLSVEREVLDSERPEAGGEGQPGFAEVAREELNQLGDLCERRRPDHMIYMLVDRTLRWLMREPPFPTRMSIVVHHAAAHYASEFGDSVPIRSRARGLFTELKIARWRRRPDAHAVLTTDPVSARRWNRRAGAPAYFLPGPLPEVARPIREGPRKGCIVFGALDARKGLDLIAEALVLRKPAPPLTVAGQLGPGYGPELERCLERMRAGGGEVVANVGGIPAEEVGPMLGSALCALITYRNHWGISQVMYDAVAAGTPVVATQEGLVGHLVREHGLGLTVDPHDPADVRAAIDELTAPGARESYLPALERFIEKFSGAYGTALRAAVLGGSPGEADEREPARLRGA